MWHHHRLRLLHRRVSSLRWRSFSIIGALFAHSLHVKRLDVLLNRQVRRFDLLYLRYTQDILDGLERRSIGVPLNNSFVNLRTSGLRGIAAVTSFGVRQVVSRSACRRQSLAFVRRWLAIPMIRSAGSPDNQQDKKSGFAVSKRKLKSYACEDMRVSWRLAQIYLRRQ